MEEKLNETALESTLYDEEDIKPVDLEESLKKDLKEGYNKEDLLTDEQLKELNDRINTLVNETKDNQITHQEYYEKIRELSKLRRELAAHERAKKYLEASDELATEEDWEECLSNLPEEFEFEDLEVEVQFEETSAPVDWNYSTDSIIWKDYPAQTGYINKYTMIMEPSEDLVAEFLKKDVTLITKRDLIFDPDDYYSFILEAHVEDAAQEAEEAWENGQIDYDEVDWIESEPY